MVKKVVSLLLMMILAISLFSCTASFRLNKDIHYDFSAVSQQLAGETSQNHSADIAEATSTDTYWQNYLADGVGHNKAENGDWLDDNIVTVIPKYYFYTLGSFSYIGSEWGFYLHTTQYKEDVYNVDVFLFDVLISPFSLTYIRETVDPVLEYQYRCVLNYDKNNEGEAAHRVIRAGDEECLNRYYLGDVVMTLKVESENPRTKELYTNYINSIEYHVNGEVYGNQDDDSYFIYMVPNSESDTDLTMLRRQEIDDEMSMWVSADALLSFGHPFSDHEFFFGDFLQSLSVQVGTRESLVVADPYRFENMGMDQTYYYRWTPAVSGMTPKDFQPGEQLTSALIVGMNKYHGIDFLVDYGSYMPRYNIENDTKTGWQIEVSSEMMYDAKIEMNILYQTSDGTMVKVAETSGERQGGPVASYGETLALYETFEATIRLAGFSSDYRLYVEQDGTYRFLNGGYQDGSEIYVFDDALNVVAHITESTYEVTLDNSMMYFVVAKFQDEEKTGSYHISVWPL